MSPYDYEVARDLDHAWLNFELDLPLRPARDGRPNPFYLSRPESTLSRIIDELLSPFHRPPKIFISGHRGTGKSTELWHLMGNLNLQRKFWPINFSIREETDIIDIDVEDILFAIGSRLYSAYKRAAGTLPTKLINDLESWRGEIEIEIRKATGEVSESEISAGIDAFFANAGLKVRLEPTYRKTIRQVLRPRTIELIILINKIIASIYEQERRIPLVIIDDLDKLGLDISRKLFGECLDLLLLPNCAIIYVTTMTLVYSDVFDFFRDRAYFLPAVTLHAKGDKEKIYIPGYQMLRSIIEVRMDLNLITEEAIDAAIRFSGGIVREECRLIRSAIGRARREHHEQIVLSDVVWAVSEIRNEYRRILNIEELNTIREIVTGKKSMTSDSRALLQHLAILEYLDNNGNGWFESHPALEELLMG
jgi:hypothetical protein